MSTFVLWSLLVVIGLGTFAERISFIYLFGRVEIPGWLRRALRFVPAAVLASLVFPAMTSPTGVLNLSLGNYRLLAGLVGALVAWRTRNVLLTLSAGMLVLWGLQAVFGH